MIRPLMMLPLALSLIAGTAHAGEHLQPAFAIEKSRLDTGKQTLDPERGYIALHSPRGEGGAKAPTRLLGAFLRQPDASTMDAWRADMDKAMVKAKKRYAADLELWQGQVQQAAQVKVKPPEKPPEPTEAMLTVTPLEIRDAFTIGPMFVYEKGADTVSYLESVKPGTYILYGPITVLPDDVAVGGPCLCMGTVAFEVKPGVVTDLGDLLARVPTADNTALLPTGKLPKPVEAPARQGPYTMVATTGLPKGMNVVPAELHAHGKVNNYYGLFVSRLSSIEGVLAYHRDKVVDVRSGQDLPDPTITSHAKPKV